MAEQKFGASNRSVLTKDYIEILNIAKDQNYDQICSVFRKENIRSEAIRYYAKYVLNYPGSIDSDCSQNSTSSRKTLFYFQKSFNVDPYPEEFKNQIKIFENPAIILFSDTYV
jgi:outer membrane lipopolysaccharide assembly protein LptE/RlpB